MYKNVMTAIGQMELIKDRLDREKNCHQYYDLEEKMVTKERAFSDRSELINILKKFYCKYGFGDEFITLFGMYCNLYIIVALHLALKEDDFFGINELFEIITDISQQEYLKNIQQGVYYQDIKFFDNAIVTFSGFSLPYFYEYIYVLKFLVSTTQEDILNNEDRVISLYNSMNELEGLLSNEYKQYLWGESEFIKDSYNPAENRNYLPYIKYIDYHEEVDACLISDLSVINTTLKRKKFIDNKSNITFENIITGIKKASEKNDMQTVNTVNIFINEIFRRISILNESKSEDFDFIYYTPEYRDNTAIVCRYCYLYLPLKISHVGNGKITLAKEIKNKQDIIKAKEELQESNNDKNAMVSDFTHRYKNLAADNLYQIAKALITNPENDEELKDKGRELLVEYDNKQMLSREVVMLNLEHTGRFDELTRLIKRSKESDAIKGVNIDQIINEALKRDLIRILVSTGEDRVEQIRKKFDENGIDTWVLLEKYEQTVLRDYESCIQWINSNMLRVNVLFSEEWKTMYLGKKTEGEVFLMSLLMELVFNIFTYADINKEVDIIFGSMKEKEKEYLTITTSNYVNYYVDGYTQKGLASRSRILSKLNYNTEYKKYDSIITNYNQDDKTFTVTVKILKDLFV